MEVVFGLLLMLLGVCHAPVSSVLLVFECLSQGDMRESHVSEVLKEENISTCSLITCTLSDGTYVSLWVLDASNNLCNEPPTTPTMNRTVVSTVGAIIRKWKKHHLIINRPRTGAPRKISDQGVRKMVRRVLKEPRTNRKALQKDMEAAAPVSSVLLVFECLSQGDMRVSCSSEGGDSPQYSWTLDGHTLTDAELLSGNNEAKDIILKQGVSGQLVCSVRNHMSVRSRKRRRYPPAVSEKKSFINCTLCNGTHISLWVLDASNNLCNEPTNPTMKREGKESDIKVSIKSSTHITLISQSVFSSMVLQSLPADLWCASSCGDSHINRDWRLFCLEEKEIQLLLSSVRLVFECLSQGDMRVSCSSEGGDSPQYSWTLDGHTLTDAELLSGNNEAKDIILKQGVSGQLVCSVRNNVSEVSKEKEISTCSLITCTLSDGIYVSLWVLDYSNNLCKEPTTTPTMNRTVAPVSSVLLVFECLSQGDMRVSCSSEGGDSPQYSWTLDGHTLTDTELLSGNNEAKDIIFKQGVSGQLVCSVRNHISEVSKKRGDIQPAVSENKNRSLLICGVRAAVVILILIGIAVYFAWKKKKYESDGGSAVSKRMENQENSVLMVEMRSSASEM
ncbi:hypothetical protein L3Q82_020622 [Scortum barcoo]|uniref:Uncharacterized protein n=1 Tax=Scortum barcoo TaxID=214431 RepID=A0ACB8V8E1_9TELE|nr:hypothetical protein L3Q82_020622 [Scortum barcoo]